MTSNWKYVWIDNGKVKRSSKHPNNEAVFVPESLWHQSDDVVKRYLIKVYKVHSILTELSEVL